MKNSILSACLVSMLMVNLYGMTTGKYVPVDWTEEEQLCLSACEEFFRETKNGIAFTQDDIDSYAAWIDKLMEPLQYVEQLEYADDAPLTERVKFNSLKQLKKYLSGISNKI